MEIFIEMLSLSQLPAHLSVLLAGCSTLQLAGCSEVPLLRGAMIKLTPLLRFTGGRVKTWKRRWFILTDNCLYYFEYTTVSALNAFFDIPISVLPHYRICHRPPDCIT